MPKNSSKARQLESHGAWQLEFELASARCDPNRHVFNDAMSRTINTPISNNRIFRRRFTEVFIGRWLHFRGSLHFLCSREMKAMAFQFCITSTLKNSLAVGVPVTVAVTVVIPGAGVPGVATKVTEVPSRSVAPVALNVARSFDQR